MKIGVISDTHGSLFAWNQAVNGPLHDVDLVLHGGDVLYHGARNPLPQEYQPAVLADLINAFKTPLMIVKGNCDSEVDQMVLDIPIQAPYLITDQPIGRILITHGHYYGQEQAEELASRYRIDIWISGHTHEPILEKCGETIFLNPGSCALPKGDQPRSSVAVISETEIVLVDLNTEEVFKRLARY